MELKDCIHLYIGCKMSVTNLDERFETVIDYETIPRYYDEEGGRFMNDLKLILRLLPDMKDNEKEELGLNLTQSISVSNNGFCKWDVIQFQYLLSKGFDLFGLIDAGLAINSTTLNNGN